jgi:hypothetical protein
MASDPNVTITMRRQTLLVVFEFLTQSYESWKKTGPKSDDSFLLRVPDEGERVALWRLEGEIERTLPEIFSPEYQRLIREEKNRLRSELYGL